MKKIKSGPQGESGLRPNYKNGPKHLQNQHNNEIFGSTLFNARKDFFKLRPRSFRIFLLC